MKKIVALASVFALAACGGSEADQAAGEDVAMEDAGPAMPDSAGTYMAANEDGAEWVLVLNDDGSYEESVGGEVAASGPWEDTMRGTCLKAEGVEGEQCYNIPEAAADGTVAINAPDGTPIAATKEM